ncbi:two-component regulator propeller domain-containing protein [Chromobacterium alticapitis]|uniref:two-component regulator propeller domain-containing protein n=1 Tax=Chromobacterium alticapitis TaxID=2073169 RepID=UPI001304969D|nr:two-component regulator propeller domain-containing protein [Chromobacterium alticapitis]
MADAVFTHLGKEQGLPDTVVTSLAEDGAGFLWIGTQGGLARWDGYRFRNYQPDSHQAGSLPDNRIRSLYADHAGHLWVGTYAAGLARYDPAKDRFTIWSRTQNNEDLSDSMVNAMLDDGRGGLWVGTENGLYHLDAQDRLSRQALNNRRDHGGLLSGQVRALALDHHGTLWVGTGGGLARRDADGGFSPVMLPAGPGQQPFVSVLHVASDGRLWIGCKQRGAFRLNPADGAATALQENGKVDSPLAHQWVDGIAEPHPGEIWLGTYGQGIVVIDQNSGETRRLRHDRALPVSLSDDYIWALHSGRNGLLWIGSQNGLSRANPTQGAILSVFGASSKPEGVTDTDVTSVLNLSDGRVWLGQASHGIDVIDPVRGRLGALRPDPSHPDRALPDGYIPAMAEASDGSVLIATGAGLYRASPFEMTVQRIQRPGRRVDGAVQAVLIRGDTAWIGGGTDGLFALDLAASSQTPLRHIPGLSSEAINAIAPAAGGKLWVGTDNGLNLYDPATHGNRIFRSNAADPASLSSNAIACLLTDRGGRLWVGTTGGGINLLQGVDADGRGRFLRLGKAQGLPDGNVDKLLADGKGRIWASADNGLAIIDSSTLRIRALSQADGLAIGNFWVGSGAAAPGGELLFGGTGGLVVVRPERYQAGDDRQLLRITELTIDGAPVPPGAQLADSRFPVLSVSAAANSLRVEFSALDYAAPERIRYAYRLEGFDKSWISADASHRTAVYTNLAPGDYRLHLRASNREGQWTNASTELPFAVQPAWYQTAWFRALLGLLALAGLYLFVWARTAVLHKQRRALSEEVERQTLALQSANAELAVSADILRQLGDVGRDITAKLNAADVFVSLQRHIAELLDCPHISLYRLSSDGSLLNRVFSAEDGKPLPYDTIPLDLPHSNSARAIREQREILTEWEPDTPSPSHMPGTRRMLTNLFVPLIVGRQTLGVMSIQSDKQHAFGERECMIFRTLCAYAAIALANGDAYHAAQTAEAQTAAALQELKHAQAQMIQQEKMASLGQLIANVAHEINTPIGAIKSSNQSGAIAFRRAMLQLLQLAPVLEDPLRELFADLLAHCHPAGSQGLSSREQRALRRSLLGELESLRIDGANQVADVFLQCHLQGGIARYTPLLLHDSRDLVLDTAQQMSIALGNAANIEAAIERVGKIVYALKSFSRHDSSGIFHEVDVRDSIDTVLTIYQHQLRQGVEVVREYEDVPRIPCLPDELGQVWTNLAHNALQAMNGKGTLTIVVRQSGDEVAIAMRDTGHGIPAAIRDKIFEPFFTTRRSGEGSGLGLDIVSKIIARHHGRIEIDSEEGRGATFTVFLPMRQMEA